MEETFNLYMDQKFGANLLGDNQQGTASKLSGDSSRFVKIGILLIVIVLLSYFGLIWYKGIVQDEIDDIKSQQTVLESNRDKKSESEILLLNEQLDIAEKLLKKHVVWSEAVKKLQQSIQPKVQLSSLQADFLTAKYNFEAIASDYTTVAKQIASLYKDTAIINIDVSNLTQSDDGTIDFSMTITFDPKILNNIDSI